MHIALKTIYQIVVTLTLLAFSSLGNSAQSADCMPLDKVENIRQKALSAQNDYLTATQEYLASMSKVYELRTTVYECQSGQSITGSIFGSCNDVIMKYNMLAERTGNLESRKDTLKSLAQLFIDSYQSAAATACKQ